MGGVELIKWVFFLLNNYVNIVSESLRGGSEKSHVQPTLM